MANSVIKKGLDNSEVTVVSLRPNSNSAQDICSAIENIVTANRCFAGSLFIDGWRSLYGYGYLDGNNKKYFTAIIVGYASNQTLLASGINGAYNLFKVSTTSYS